MQIAIVDEQGESVRHVMRLQLSKLDPCTRHVKVQTICRRQEESLLPLTGVRGRQKGEVNECDEVQRLWFGILSFPSRVWLFGVEGFFLQVSYPRMPDDCSLL